MKNRKRKPLTGEGRKLKEEERKHNAQVDLYLLSSAEMPTEREQRKAKNRKGKSTEAHREAKLRAHAKTILLLGRISPNSDDPLEIARYLAQEIFDSPSAGWRQVRQVIKNEVKWNFDQRFLPRMLIKLGEYLLTGKERFDDLDFQMADIVARHAGKIPLPAEMFRELQKRCPKLDTKDKIKKRMKWLKSMPMSDLEPPT